MIRKLVLLLMVILLAAACGGEESRVRSAVESTFMACQRGDISFALDYLHPSTDMATILYALQDEDAAEYDRTLAELGARSKSILKEISVTFESISIASNTAEAEISFHQEDNELGRQTISLIQQDGNWKLLELPNVKAE